MVFFSTYKLYKQGTAQVVSWLGKTAAQFGYELRSADKPKQERKPKKKGSKRNAQSVNASRSQPTKYMVSIKELPELARVVSKHVREMSTLKALTGILEVLNDVIVKRKQWAETFKLPDTTTLTSNRQHSHFVSVLEDVYEILRGVGSASKQNQEGRTLVADNNEESTSTEEIALSNLFAVLDIEEPADQEETIPRPAQSPSPSKPPAIVTYELDDEIDHEEIYFMIYCFFKDFMAVRNHLGQIWADYTSGKLDLPAVAITTNVALEMLQRAEIVLLESLPKKYNLTGYERIACLLCLAVAHARGVEMQFRERADDVINMELKDIADFTCGPVYIILSSFLPVLQGPSFVPVVKPGHFGKIDLTGKALSWRAKFTQDKIVLCEFLPEFCVLKQVDSEIPVVDELSRGLMKMMRKKIIPIWLVLGCQIYLDIHHTMLSRIGMAHKELQTMGLHVSTAVEDFLDFSKDMSIENWPEHNNKGLRMMKQEVDLWVNRDFFAATQKRLFRSAKLPESTIRPYSLLSRHPLYCGVVLFRLNLRFQEAGTALVTNWGSLPSVMHLYNAVKHENLEDGFPSWGDVEAVIQIQGEERIFVGDKPKISDEYIKRFSLAMGFSASIFAQNRRELRHTPQTQTPASKRGPREMVLTSPIADIFRPQYCGNETRSEVTFAKIEKLLSTSSKGQKTGMGSHHRPRSFTSVSFLSYLQGHIQADILALNIDYFALHMRCIDLLRDIHVKLHPEFLKYAGRDYLVKESELPFLVGYLFLIARGSGMAAESLLGAGQAEAVKSAVLMKAGELVKNLVQKEGDLELRRVRKVCPGYGWRESVVSM